LVSNGLEFVATDAAGRYEIELDDADGTVFVVKPRDWQTPLSEKNLPRFYYMHKPAGSPDEGFKYRGVAPTGPLPASIDFPLVHTPEPEDFTVLVVGDPQPRTREEVNFYANDVVAELIDTQAKFGISLGDIVWDDLSLFDLVNGVQAQVGIPWYNVLGNHDVNRMASEDRYSDETFERFYGPPNYMFQFGSVHFIVLDNVQWNGLPAKDAAPKALLPPEYEGVLSDRQLEFVANYLQRVPREELVVVCTHIPLFTPDNRTHSTRGCGRLLELLADRPHQMSFSAHTHYTRGDFIDQGDALDPERLPHHTQYQLHYHHNTATGSGSWFRGPKDEQGLPMTPMRDGTPNGYAVASFTGAEFKLRYKAARMPAEFQMAIHAPQAILAEHSAAAEMVVNVFHGTEQTKVRMRIRKQSDWLPMTRTEREDPAYRAAYERDLADADRPHEALPVPIPCPHIWVATLPPGLGAGMHTVEVEATDMFGQVDRAFKLIDVCEAAETE
jgi:hypothetical protein